MVVDEGPGLSGSSFGAVIDAVTGAVGGAAAAGVATAGGAAAGVAAASVRIELYLGHAGEPGPSASDAERARWRGLPRRVEVGVPARVAARALAELVGPIAGPVEGPLEDLSAGRVARAPVRERGRVAAGGGAPGAVQAPRARGRRAGVARFAGLGRAGAHALRRSRELEAAGFGPPVAGLAHGFLVERWLDDAAPLDPARYPRERLIEQVGRYLAFRRRALPAGTRAAPRRRSSSR